MRSVDLSLLEQLGPYIKALAVITARGQKNRRADDVVRTGKQMLEEPEGLSSRLGVDLNLAGAFLLWRGAPMRNEWIEPYVNQVGRGIVYMAGNSSCSRDPKVALMFAFAK